MAGISSVVVHITYGIRSSSECDTTCEKIRDAVKEVVQHAEVSWERSEDYGKITTSFGHSSCTACPTWPAQQYIYSAYLFQ